MLYAYLSISWYEIEEHLLVLGPILDDVPVRGEYTTDEDVISVFIRNAQSNDKVLDALCELISFSAFFNHVRYLLDSIN